MSPPDLTFWVMWCCHCGDNHRFSQYPKETGKTCKNYWCCSNITFVFIAFLLFVTYYIIFLFSTLIASCCPEAKNYISWGGCTFYDILSVGKSRHTALKKLELIYRHTNTQHKPLVYLCWVKKYQIKSLFDHTIYKKTAWAIIVTLSTCYTLKIYL